MITGSYDENRITYMVSCRKGVFWAAVKKWANGYSGSSQNGSIAQSEVTGDSTKMLPPALGPLRMGIEFDKLAVMRDVVQTRVVTIPTSLIVDWGSFHDVFDQALGFPGYYGRNMDAWIDCLTCADDHESEMIANPVASGDLLALSITDAAEFKQRCPEQFDALLRCAAFVNYRRREVGYAPELALLIDGYFA